MGKKYILFLIMFFASFFGFSQSITIGTNGIPNEVVACGDNATFSFNVFGFSSGAVINVALPPGAKFVSLVSGNASAVATANGANFTLTANTPGSGAVIEYLVQTNCNQKMTTPKITYSSSVMSTPLTDDFSSVQYPVLEVSNVAAVGATSINVNQAATYDVTITNSNAYANTIKVEVRHSTRVTLSLDNPAVGTITFGTPSGGVQTDIIEIAASQITTVGDHDSKFELNENYTFRVKATLNTCSLNGESIEFRAAYGCDGSLCFEIPIPSSVGLTQNGAGNPSLTLAATKIPRAGIMGQPDNGIFVLTNNGTGTAYNVEIRLGFNNVAGSFVPTKRNYYDFYNVNVNGHVINDGGTNSDRFPIKFTSDPDGPGVGFEDLDGDGFYDDLAPGATVTIDADFKYRLLEYLVDCVEMNTGAAYLRWTLVYANACNAISINSEDNSSYGSALKFTSILSPVMTHSIEPVSTTGLNFEQGDRFRLAFNYGAQSYLYVRKSQVGASNAFLRFKVKLPAGVTPDLTTNPSSTQAGYTITLNAAVSDPVAGIYYYDMITTSTDLTLATNGLHYFPFVVDSGCNTTGTFSIESSFQIFESPTTPLPKDIACGESNSFTLRCAPGVGIDMEEFELNRDSFGFGDMTKTNRLNENSPGINLKGYLNGDKAKAIYKLKILDPSLASAQLILEFDKHPSDFLKQGTGNAGVKEIDITYTDPDTNVATNFTLLPANFGTDLVVYNDSYVVDGVTKSGYTFDILKLFEPGRVLSGVTKKANATIDYVVHFRLNENDWQRNTEVIKGLKSYTLIKQTLASTEIIGDQKSDGMTIHYYAPYMVGNQGFEAIQCNHNQRLLFGVSHNISNSGNPLFPNEYRYNSYSNSYTVLIPIGIIPKAPFQHQKADATYLNIDPPSLVEYGFNADGTPNPNGMYNKYTFVNPGNWPEVNRVDGGNALFLAFSYDISNKFRDFYANSGLGNAIRIYNIGTENFYGLDHETPKILGYTFRASTLTLNLLEYSVGANPTTLTTNTNIASWDVTITNSSASGADLPNTWIALEGPAGMDNVTFWYGATQLPTINYGNGKFWAHVGSVPFGDRVIRVQSSKFGACGTGKYTVKVGYDCAAYPISPLQEFTDPTSPAPYSRNVNLNLITQEPALSATSSVNSNNTTKFDICSEITETLTITNGANGYTYLVSPEITLPNGMSLITGSFVVKYNGQNYPLSPSAIIAVDGSGKKFRVDINTNANIPFVTPGLPGTTENNAALRRFQLEFKMITSCDANVANRFVSGSRVNYRINGQSGCGQELPIVAGLTSFRSNAINLNGAPANKEYSNSIVSLESPNTEANHHVDDQDEFTVTVQNINGAVGLDLETIKIFVDDAYDYVPGSFVQDFGASTPGFAVGAPTISVDQTGKRVMVWNVPTGFSVGNLLQFNFKVKVVDPASLLCADQQYMTLNTYIGGQVNCATTNTTCDLEFPTGVEKEVMLKAYKPAIDAVMTNSILSGNNTFTNYQLDYEVSNLDTTYEVKPGLAVQVYRDINGNGVIDGSDVIVPGANSIATAIAPGGTVSGTLSGTYSGAMVNLLIRFQSVPTISDICESVVITSFPCAPGASQPTFVASTLPTQAAPADTIEAVNIPAVANVRAVDNYNNNVTIDFVETEIRTPGDCPGKYTIERKWTATDDCGNTNVHTQLIYVADKTAPVATLAANLLNVSVSCDDPMALANIIAQAPTVTDNVTDQTYLLDPTKGLTYDNGIASVVTSCGATYTRTRTWTFTDECGNVSNTITQVINVVDTKAPTIVTAPNVLNRTVECSDAAGLAAAIALAPTATDNCTTTTLVPNVVSDVTAPAANCPNGYVRTRVWNFDDGCGNISANYIQTITVVDTQAPVITTPVGSLNVTLECSDGAGLNTALTAVPVATDNCTPSLNLTLVIVSDITTPNISCGKGYVRSRTWNFKDACGNTSANFTQVITVVDTTAPVLTTVANALDRTVQCSDTQGLNAALALAPIASDNCSIRANLTINLVTDITTATAGCAKGYTRVRTWNFEDECGNVSANFVQTITVIDTEAPTITTATNTLNRTLECSDSVGIAAAVALFPTATDNCSGVAGVTINVVSDNTVATCAKGYVRTRTWNFTDECGNTSSNFVQVITVQDTQVPVVTTLANSLNRTLECSDTAGLTAAMALRPSATDNCSSGGGITMNVSPVDRVDTCANGYVLTRKWNFTDECGNTSADFVQTITVQDTKAPVITTATFALDRTVECSNAAGLTAALALAPIATDNCSTAANVTMTLLTDNTVTSLNCANGYTRTRIWNFTDECGNVSANYIQTITVVDTTAPVITTVAGSLDVTLECSDSAGLTTALALVPAATDVCTTNPIITLVTDITTPSTTCGKGYTRVRTWNFRDACGNTSTNFVQTITVQDTTAPVVSTAVASLDRTVQCSDAAGLNAALALAPIATDNCSSRASLTINLVSDVKTPTCINGYTQVRTWNFEDECGNVSANFVQTITVVDTQAPTITTAPNTLNRTLECTDSVGLAQAINLVPTASDNCSGVSGITMNVVSDDTVSTCTKGYVRTRTWNFTDECGNTSANFVQVITVQDTQAPVISTVANSLNRTLECSDAAGIAAAMALKPNATDNCSTGTGVTMNAMPDVTTTVCANGYILTRTWNFTDECGNTSADFIQVITVQDTKAPVITTASFALDKTVECSNAAGLTAALALEPTATDNCSTAANITMTLVSDNTIASLNCANGYTRTRTWNFTDECGNVSANYIQTITVVDTTAPVITTVAGSLDATLECSDSAGLTTALALVPAATDVCSANVIMTLVSDTTTLNPTCSKGYTRVRTWNFRDVCGNTSTNFVQTITVQDTTAPVVSTAVASLDRTVECSNPAGLNAALALVPIATDNCSTRASLTMNLVSDVTTATCTNGYTQVRTWNFEDECGNVSANFVQTITVVDTQAPIITTAPSSLNRTLECSDSNGLAQALTLIPTATDNCSSFANVTMNVVSDVTVSTCANGYTRTRTWNFTDECGNTSANYVQVITVQDKQAPVISTIANSLNRTLECSDAAGIAAAMALVPTAKDNCSTGAGITMNAMPDVTTTVCANGYILTRTWNFTDECGNTSSNFVQTITVQDTKAPVIATASFALDRTVECSNTAALTAALALAPTATDNCSTGTGIVMNLVSDQRVNSLTCTSGYTQLRTWNFTDECGNVSANYVQTIIVVDTTAPVITTVAGSLDATLECSDSVGLNDALALEPTATDNCSTNVIMTLVSDTTTLNPTCSKGYTRVRTWNFRDVCGNTSTNFVQRITVQDTTAPVVSTAVASLDRTVECSNPAGLNAALALIPVATDNCSTRASLTINLVSDVTTATCANGYTQVRTWNFEDECGNVSANFVQTITVVDTQAPTITTAPSSLNRTLECSDSIGLAQALTLIPTATDNCSSFAAITMTLVSDLTTATCAQGYVRTRTWNFTDECGNTSANYVQVITVQDTQAPVISTVANALNRTLECSDTTGIASALALAPTAKDNCSATADLILNLVSDVTTATCGNTYVQVRTWNFTDECGNTSADFVQTLTIIDTTAPVITTAAGNLNRTVECSDTTGINDALALVPSATDNCSASADLTIHLVSDVTTATCASGYIQVRTWNFEDECGNVSANFVQTITVQDTTSPTFVGTLPADVTVSCDAVPLIDVLTATDNCGIPTVTSSEVRTSGSCPNSYTLTRTWIADDGCNNTTVHTQTITVVDTTAPTFVGTLPSDLTLECQDEIPTMAILTATDNCGTATVASSEVITNGSCANSFIIVRTWIATDECGLTTTHTQTITVQDITAPTFVGTLPTDLTLECSDEVPVIAVLAAVDNCGLATVSSIEVRTNGSCPNTYTLVRTWTATDECGLTSTYSQTINVVDTTAPEFIGTLPTDLVLECSDAVPHMATLTAKDNCGYATVSATEVVTNGSCANTYTIVRTWTATDECGNSVTHTQNITVQDTTAPEFVEMLPTDITVECDSVPTIVELTATDNCGFAKVVSTEVRTDGNCPNNYTLLRTWTATDECGNTTVHTQTVTVQDTTAPEFVGTLPAKEIFIKCEDLKDAEQLSAIDNCGEVTITTNDQLIPGDCDTKYTIVRTWTATDSCNNATTFEQIIHLSCQIEIFNAVSPNGDGFNDELVLNGIECYPGNSVEIYNRWGVVVYKTNNYNSNGNTFKGHSEARATINGGSLLPSGTYYYLVKYNYDLGNGEVYPKEQTGFFQLESN